MSLGKMSAFIDIIETALRKDSEGFAVSSDVVLASVRAYKEEKEHSYIQQSGTIYVYGISFYAYGLYPFVNKPLEVFQDKINDLYIVSPSLAEKLNSAIIEIPHFVDNKELTPFYPKEEENDDVPD
jgi:hypothetical protein